MVSTTHYVPKTYLQPICQYLHGHRNELESDSETSSSILHFEPGSFVWNFMYGENTISVKVTSKQGYFFIL